MTLQGKSRIAVAWLVVTGLCSYFEFQRWMAATSSAAGPLGWFASWDPETTLPFLVLLTLPVLCLVGKSHRPSIGSLKQPHSSVDSRWLKCLLVFCVSIASSGFVGWQPISIRNGLSSESMAFCDMPPAYHDEYSYLLQAQTFAAGRLSWPPAPTRPDLFHQVHVLNEHRTASRYFPWTGLWMAAFLQTGKPILGHWLAGGLAAAFFYLTASETLRPRPALVAGLLIGCSPGLALFSNMLLAHHPTMLVLSIFLWAMVRLLARPSVPLTLISGTALSLAMLGRPMTAAGFALPWGLFFGWRIIRCSEPAWGTQRMRLVAAMTVPLCGGFVALGILNHNITGSFFRSGYQEYTDVYTPRHTYGFNNGIRGDAAQTPKVLKNYDQWAENLTWPVAMRNVGYRCLASAQWTLGIVPIVMGLVLLLLRIVFPQNDTGYQSCVLWLLTASVLSLHLVHIPYWFSGIMHWHYVFETAPLLLILIAGGLVSIVDELSGLTSRRMCRVWLTCFVMASLVPGWLSAEATWGSSKIASGTSELAWSRRHFELFHRMMGSDAVEKPALVLVDETNSDPQLSYIINDPAYQSNVLVARLPETPQEIRQLQSDFSNRRLYRFDPTTFVITPIGIE